MLKTISISIVLGTTYIFSIPTIVAVAAPEVKEIARDITVQIDGPSRGSGIIIERSSDRYYILTNAHVVDRVGIYSIITPDGERHLVDTIKQLQLVDLAVLSFRSSVAYPIAKIGAPVSVGQAIYVSGWTRSGGTLRQQIFVTTEGQLTETHSKLPAGYSLSYTNLVRAGMSGGPILNQQGQLIGVNGLVRLAGSSGKVVASGIEINQFLNQRASLNLPASNSTNTARLPASINSPTSSPYTLASSLASTDSVSAIAFAAKSSNNVIVCGSSDGTISLWNLATEQQFRSWQGHNQAVNTIAVSSNGEMLASGSDDGTVKLWHLPTGKLVRTLTGHQSSVSTLAFSPNGKTLASGSWDKTIKVWQVATGKLLYSLTGHSGLISAVAVTPNNQAIASGSQDGTIRLWDLTTGKLLRTLTGHSLSVLSLAIAPNGKTLASGSGEGTIGLWNLSTGQLTGTLKGHTDGVWSVTISQGDTLISGSWDRTIKLWDVKTAKLKHTLEGHSSYVVAVVLSSDEQTLVSSGWDRRLLIWRKSERPRRETTGLPLTPSNTASLDAN